MTFIVEASSVCVHYAGGSGRCGGEWHLHGILRAARRAGSRCDGRVRSLHPAHRQRHLPRAVETAPGRQQPRPSTTVRVHSSFLTVRKVGKIDIFVLLIFQNKIEQSVILI